MQKVHAPQTRKILFGKMNDKAINIPSIMKFLSSSMKTRQHKRLDIRVQEINQLLAPTTLPHKKKHWFVYMRGPPQKNSILCFILQMADGLTKYRTYRNLLLRGKLSYMSYHLHPVR